MRVPSYFLELASGDLVSSPVTVTESDVLAAVDHRVAALVLAAAERGEIGLESNAGVQLGKAVLESRHRNRWLREQAIEATTQLRQIGVDVAVLKGIAAEERWYASVGDRPTTDLDLWVSPEDLDRVSDVLDLLHPRHPLRNDIGDLVRNRRIRSVDLVWNGVPIDLHFDPFKYGIWYPQLGHVWNRCVMSLEGYMVLDEAAALLLALIHLNKDRFSRLIGFVDVYRGSADPDTVEGAWSLASEIGLTIPVASTAAAVGETLGEELGFSVPRPGWKSVLWSRLWPRDTRLLGSDGLIVRRHRQDWIPLLSDSNTVDKLRHLKHVWFPPLSLVHYFNPEVSESSYMRALWKARVGG